VDDFSGEIFLRRWIWKKRLRRMRDTTRWKRPSKMPRQRLWKRPPTPLLSTKGSNMASSTACARRSEWSLVTDCLKFGRAGRERLVVWKPVSNAPIDRLCSQVLYNSPLPPKKPSPCPLPQSSTNSRSMDCSSMIRLSQRARSS
jgi:hypothetical protein